MDIVHLQPGTKGTERVSMPDGECATAEGIASKCACCRPQDDIDVVSAGGQSAEGGDPAAVCHVRTGCAVHAAGAAARLGCHRDCRLPAARKPHCRVDS